MLQIHKVQKVKKCFIDFFSGVCSLYVQGVHLGKIIKFIINNVSFYYLKVNY